MPKRTRDHQSWLIEKLADPVRAAEYLSTAYEDSREMFLEALRDVAQARQMTKVAREAGVTRESLYRATSDIGNPTLETLGSILEVLGIKIRFTAENSISVGVPGPQGQSREVPVEQPHPTMPVTGGQTQGFYRPHKLASPSPRITKLAEAAPWECVIANAQREEEYVSIN